MKVLFIAALSFLSFDLYAKDQFRPVALIYKGEGSCEEDCSESLARIAENSGYRVKFVGPKETSPEVFRGAKVWLQPGGLAAQQIRAMAPELQSNIFKFVQNGGGYVGVCAGAMLASEQFLLFDKNQQPKTFMALGFFPGNVSIYDEPNSAAMIESLWESQVRHLYWELGPTFDAADQWGPEIEILSRYPNGAVATVRRTFGKGRVYVTAFHPEAPQSWRDYFRFQDQDGLDFDLVAKMIAWTQGRAVVNIDR
jgi:glutamine amidotransferase-like uncharacterized protein